MSNINLIGAKIKEIRRAKKISQEKLAEIISMNHRTINRIENCHTIPTLETLDKIAKALNVKITDFFETDSVESRENIIKNITSIIDRLEECELRNFYKAVCNFFI